MSAESMTSQPPSAPPGMPSTPPKRSPILVVVVVIIVAIVVAIAGLYFAGVGPFAKSTPSPLEAGGFTKGSVVTFVYSGTYECVPGLLTFYPGQTLANTTANSCEVGNASQSAVVQVPEWVLVPAYAGLSIFGVTALGANARGFPVFESSAVLTDCGAGGSPTGCSDHPNYLYSPAYTAVEQSLGITTGYGTLPEGVLPTPAHDHLIDTAASFPNIEWGTIVVLVFDPNIFPDRATGSCSTVVTSNLSSPTGNCLTSLAALEAALTTQSTSVATANSGNHIWTTLRNSGAVDLQVLVPGDVTVSQINNLDSNLYIPFSVQPGAPSSFPT